MPARRTRHQAMYNTPTLRNGGFGALQVEAVTNRPLSIARRHLAASQLRIRDIEPDQLTSSEWVRFLVMDERERDRWMGDFNRRRRRGSDESNSSSSSSGSGGSGAAQDADAAVQYDKAEEARREAEEAADCDAANGDVSATTTATAPTSVSFLQVETRRSPPPSASTSSYGDNGSSTFVSPASRRAGRTPSVSIWARQFDERIDSEAATSATVYSAWSPRHARRAVTTDGMVDPPPTYESAVRSPPAYEAAVPAIPSSVRR